MVEYYKASKKNYMLQWLCEDSRNLLLCHGTFKIKADSKSICTIIPLFKNQQQICTREKTRGKHTKMLTFIKVWVMEKWKSYFFPVLHLKKKLKTVWEKASKQATNHVTLISIRTDFPEVIAVSMESDPFFMILMPFKSPPLLGSLDAENRL